MLSYHDLKPNPRVLRAFTSVDPEEFAILLIPFEKAWHAYISKYYIHKKARKRRYGGGRKPHLAAIEDKLLFILLKWLRVLGTTETPQIDQGVRHQLHPIMALLDVLEPEQ